MSDNCKDFFKILKSETFLALIKADKIKIAQLNAAIALLIKCNIDFDVIFTSGTNREDPQALLTVYINPNTNIDFTFEFDGC
ncbi:MAG: hypothetical protein N4A68_04740 [Maledivibacter sp.]|jgi:hypothetical protein|nr:hypothetical protein [Maledivibacter sp.]